MTVNRPKKAQYGQNYNSRRRVCHPKPLREQNANDTRLRIAGMSIASQLPKGHEVTIVARDLPGDPDSFTWTSPWAGAIWLGMDDSPPREQKMQLEAFAHMWKLAMDHPESSVKV